MHKQYSMIQHPILGEEKKKKILAREELKRRERRQELTHRIITLQFTRQQMHRPPTFFPEQMLCVCLCWWRKASLGWLPQRHGPCSPAFYDEFFAEPLLYPLSHRSLLVLCTTASSQTLPPLPSHLPLCPSSPCWQLQLACRLRKYFAVSTPWSWKSSFLVPFLLYFSTCVKTASENELLYKVMMLKWRVFITVGILHFVWELGH